MKLGLCMIVKNEEKVIERSLRSALKFMDTWVIVDTGSTDSTMEIIRRIAKELGKPGILEQRPWVNFGHNRSEALALASGYMDWIWMLDADDTIEGDTSRIVLHSKQTGYNVPIHHGDMRQKRVHVFNSNYTWRYVGAVHEYADCTDGPYPTECLPETIWIQARTEGSRSADPLKYAKDAEMIEEELKKGADPGRNLFYLAQSYRDANNVEKAIEVYKRRAQRGGWIEETYICYVNLLKLVSTYEEKLTYACAAQDCLPDRREAIYELMLWCRKNSHCHHQVVTLLGEAYKDVPMNPGRLFVDTNAYNWRYDDELGVLAYYAKQYSIGIAACERALLTCDEGNKKRIETNRLFSFNELIKMNPPKTETPS
jgi:hypothetical protein